MSSISNIRPAPDKELVDIADYVSRYQVTSAEAYATARLPARHAGSGLEALSYPACTEAAGAGRSWHRGPMVAIGLIFGRLTAADYEDAIAADPRIGPLRAKMATIENPQYSKDYLDPDKRSIANAIQIRFKDGSTTDSHGRIPRRSPPAARRRNSAARAKIQDQPCARFFQRTASRDP